MSKKILVYIDQYKGKALPTSWEIISAGFQLAGETGGEVAAVVLGENVQDVAQNAAQLGVKEIYTADAPQLADYRPEVYADVLSGLVKKIQPEMILFPTTSRGRELAGMVAVDLDTGVMPDVTALEIQDGEVIVTRPVFGGKVFAKVRCKTKPILITVRSRVFSPPEREETQAGTVTHIETYISEDEIKTKVLENKESGGGVSLSDASIVVTGGRGVATSKGIVLPDGLDAEAAELWRAEQGFKLVRDLADAIHAAVGATRAAVDAGYISYEHQVGQTGKIVTPDIYIACGVSGAIQHLAGMRNSKLIVAINEEVDAPIFKYAHVGFIGDLHTILPALIEEFRSRN